MSPRIKQNRKLAAEIRKLEIVQTPAISCPYRSTQHYNVNLSNNSMFPAPKMTRIVLVARYDKIKLPDSNNMCRNDVQLWALATATTLNQVWEQGFFLLTVISRICQDQRIHRYPVRLIQKGSQAWSSTLTHRCCRSHIWLDVNAECWLRDKTLSLSTLW